MSLLPSRAFACLALAAAAAAAEPHPRVVKPAFPSDDVVIALVVVGEAPYVVPADGSADCTAGLQAAIDAVQAAGGGVVFLPTGRYRCAGSLRVKERVTLRGERPDPAADPRVRGTVLEPSGGRGRADDPPFVELEQGSGIKDLSIWYPEQRLAEPTPYPWTIRQLGGDLVTVERVTLVNSWRGFQCGPGGNELHTLRGVCGSPLACGVWMDSCTDIGRLVHLDFAPRWWAASGLPGAPEEAALRAYTARDATGIEMRRSDWEYTFDVKLDGYARGIHLLAGAQGTTNAVFYGVDAVGGGCGVRIDATNGMGVAFTSCSFAGSDAAVVLGGGSADPAQFIDCDLAGGAMCVRGEGAAPLTLHGCRFAGWSDVAVALAGGSLALVDGDFALDRAAVRTAPAVRRALLVGNRFAGAAKLELAPGGDVQVSRHGPAFAHPPKRRTGLPRDPRPRGDALIDVRSRGAVPDQGADCTTAFQAALDAAGATGGTVFVPGGRWTLAGRLRVPAGVELRGCSDVPHHTASGGSVLLTTAGRGEEDGEPFITLAAGAGLRGLTVWYPEQDANAIAPYPWAIRSAGAGSWVIDVALANAWQGADFASAPSDGCLIRYLAGAPLRRGLALGQGSPFVDSCQFNPHFWGRRPADLPCPPRQPPGEDLVMRTWELQQDHLDGFIVGSCPRLAMVDNFLFADLHGLLFAADAADTGAFVVNHGSDRSCHGVAIEAGRDIVLINTEVAVFGPGDAGGYAALETGSAFAGSASIFGTITWASGARTLVARGSGTVTAAAGNSLTGPIVVEGGSAAIDDWRFDNRLAESVVIGEAAGPVRMTADRGPEPFRFTARANAAGVVNGLGAGGAGSWRTGFEPGQPGLIAPDRFDPIAAVENASCRVVDGGRDGGHAVRLAGDDRVTGPSYAYALVAQASVAVGPDTRLRYWIQPADERSRRSAVDLLFSDGSTLRDSAARDAAGNSLHPGAAKGRPGAWTLIESPIGRWLAGKTVERVIVAYDDGETTGAFAVLVDDIEIGGDGAAPPILAFDPDIDAGAAPLRLRITGGAGEADLRFTLDGSIPSPASPRVGDAIVLDRAGLQEVRVLAFAADGSARSPVLARVVLVR